MEKKYELVPDSTLIISERILHRIKALRDFGDVKAGDIGGFIECEENLSHEGNCWVYDNAMVYDAGRVFNSAKVMGLAQVFGFAQASSNSIICDSAMIYGHAYIAYLS